MPGFFGGWRDTLLMRIVDLLLALPGILLAMALIAVLGRSQLTALVSVGMTGIPAFGRVTRAQVLSLKQRDFVTAVEAFGGTSSYIMFRTVLPNAWSPSGAMRRAVVGRDSARGGAVVPWRRHSAADAELGRMLRAGKDYLYEAPSYAVLPGVALTLTILAFDSIGRALNRVLEDQREDTIDGGRA